MFYSIDVVVVQEAKDEHMAFQLLYDIATLSRPQVLDSEPTISSYFLVLQSMTLSQGQLLKSGEAARNASVVLLALRLYWGSVLYCDCLYHKQFRNSVIRNTI